MEKDNYKYEENKYKLIGFGKSSNELILCTHLLFTI